MNFQQGCLSICIKQFVFCSVLPMGVGKSLENSTQSHPDAAGKAQDLYSRVIT